MPGEVIGKDEYLLSKYANNAEKIAETRNTTLGDIKI
jgi:hypothetical protein